MGIKGSVLLRKLIGWDEINWLGLPIKLYLLSCWQAHSRLILTNHHETRNSPTQKILEERLRMTTKKEESLRREIQTMRKVMGIFFRIC